jgi:hypothetical protein
MEDAVARFRASMALSARPSTLYNLALALLHAGRVAASLQAAEQLLSDAADPEYVAFQARAGNVQRRALAQVASVTFRIEPAGATLWIDGESLGEAGPEQTTRLDPGRHRLELRHPGFVPLREDLLLQPGMGTSRHLALIAKTAPATVELSAAGAARSSHQAPISQSRKRPLWLLGAGAVTLVAAGATGLAALAADQDFREACPGVRGCDLSLVPLARRVERLGLATDLLLAGGGAITLGALVWLWMASSDASAAIDVALGLRSLCLRASY